MGAQYGDLRGPLEKQIALLKQIERNTRCLACNPALPAGATAATVTPDFTAEDTGTCTNSAVLQVNGMDIGVPVTALDTPDATEVMVGLLNTAYAGIAIFTFNEGDGTISFISNLPNVVLVTSFVCEEGE